MRARSVHSLAFATALLAGGCRGGASGGEPAPLIPEVTPMDARGHERPPPDVEPPASNPPRPAGEPKGEAFEGTSGAVEKERAPAAAAVLRDVRAGAHEDFDRVVFEVAGDLPGHKVRYVDKPPARCGSGKPTDVAGGAWLEVRLSPAQAHDDAGKPTLSRREQRPKLEVLRELEMTCDFEGVVVWALGVTAPSRYRVLELSSPPRLVVDIQHGGAASAE